jgi:DNA (cytosine-5)-methyltransferase 1
VIGSLFSGIGGLELGLEWAGLGPVRWQCEVDPWCRDALARHWPDATRYEDVRALEPATLAAVDVLCGGFPCQDVSSAGKGAGLAGSRSGLWHEFARVVEQLRPPAVVVENVASGRARWLSRVRHDLVRLGYRTDAICVGARDVGAPHRRLRIFVLAVADGKGRGDDGASRHDPDGRDVPALPDADGVAVRQRAERLSARRQGSVRDGAEPEPHDALPRAELGMGRGPDGLPAGVGRWPAGRDAEPFYWEPPRALPKMSRQATSENNRRLAALGNAVVPACAYVAGMALREMST